MANINEAIVAQMIAYAGITDLIGEGDAARLYPLVVPLNATLPAVAYEIVDSDEVTSHSGLSGLSFTRFQFTCHAADLSGASAVASQIRLCWNGFVGTLAGVKIDGSIPDSPRQGYSEQHAAPVVQIDVMVMHHGT